MNFKEIKELIKIIDESGLSELCIEQDDLKLTLKKESKLEKSSGEHLNINEFLLKERLSGLVGGHVNSHANTIPITASASASTNATAVDAGSLVEPVKVDDSEYFVKSPIVGVFYSSPTPETAAYVKVGDKIKQGQVLCIVEAMKMMNEITSEVDGEVVEVLVQNQGTVEYGQPLFKIRKA